MFVIDVCKAMADHILERKIVTYWPHEKHNLLKKLGKQVLGQVPTFESLRPLRSWINAMSKTVKQVIFSSRVKPGGEGRGHYLMWPIQGHATGQGMVFSLSVCPEQ